MALFDKAIDTVLRNEGNTYTNDPRDPGGETKYGITAATLERSIEKSIVPHGTSVKDLTKQQAIAIYKALYWDTVSNLKNIDDQDVATKLFDTLVNIGPSPAIKIMQRSINKISSNRISEDGVFGPLTLININKIDGKTILPIMRKNQADYYRNIVNNNPKRSCFLKGWLRRSEG